ncbi:MAG TPA: hypothetical protein VFK52_05730 [Nocardioidaceae bacterium]|nr:hypothetical protein [Nocardioidaceae bacterium]
MTITAGRTYAGQSAADRAAERRARLLDATLDLLGSREALSVRGVIERSGVAPRYFYEEFDDLGDAQVALFRTLVTEAEHRALAALATAPRRARDRIRAVLSEMVALMLDDPRRGRVLLLESLGSETLGALRAAELRRFAGLLVTHSGAAIDGRETSSSSVVRTAAFAMGGFTETLSEVLQTGGEVDREDLVDDLTELFLGTGWALRRMRR